MVSASGCARLLATRRLEIATYEDVAFRVLTADTHPDHSSISLFRKQHLKALSALFLDILLVCQRAGMVTLGRVALDGTKMNREVRVGTPASTRR